MIGTLHKIALIMIMLDIYIEGPLAYFFHLTYWIDIHIIINYDNLVNFTLNNTFIKLLNKRCKFLQKYVTFDDSCRLWGQHWSLQKIFHIISLSRFRTYDIIWTTCISEVPVYIFFCNVWPCQCLFTLKKFFMIDID